MLFLLAFACSPPVAINELPRVRLVEPETGDRFNDDAFVHVVMAVSDADGDAPIAVELRLGDAALLTLSSPTAEGEVEGTIGELPAGWQSFTIVADDGHGGVRESPFELEINGRPTPPQVVIEPETPVPGEDLRGRVVVAASDPEGQPMRVDWTWSKDDVTVLAGSALPAVLPGSQVRAGDTWTFTVTAKETRNGDVDTIGYSVSSAATVVLNNDPPSPPTVTVTPSAPTALHPLRCAASGAVDPQGAPVDYRLAWSVNRAGGWVLAPGQTEAVLPASAVMPGERWRCEARAWDGALESELVVAEVEVLASPSSVAAAPLRLDGLGGAPHLLDTDGDGVIDLVVGAHADGVMWIDAASVAASRGDSVVAPATGLAVPGLRGALALPDVDGDGGQELAVWDDLQLWVLFGADLRGPAPSLAAGARVFGRSPVAVTAAPVRTTPRADLFVSWSEPGDRARAAIVPAPLLSSGAEIDVTTVEGQIRSAFDDDPFGGSLSAGYDTSGDGQAELLVGVERSGEAVCASVYSRGQLVDVIEESDAILHIEHEPGEGCGRQVLFVPDLTGDGHDELLIAAPDFDRAAGRVGLFLGGDPLFTTSAFGAHDDLRVAADNIFDQLGEALVSWGDIDGDGLIEVAIGAPGAANDAGRSYVFTGAELGSLAAAATPGAASERSADRARVNFRGEDAGDLLTPLPAGDLDGDGAPELLMWSPTRARLYVWFSGS
jgi:hypothetical protein